MSKRVFLNIVSGDLSTNIANKHLAVTFCPEQEYEQIRGGLFNLVSEQQGRGLCTAFEGNLNIVPSSKSNKESFFNLSSIEMSKRVFLNIVSGDLSTNIANKHLAVTFCPEQEYEQIRGGLFNLVSEQQGRGLCTAFEGNLNIVPSSKSNKVSKLYDDTFSAMTKCSKFARSKSSRINVLFNATSNKFSNNTIAGLTVLQGVLRELSFRRQLRSFERISILVTSSKIKQDIEKILDRAAQTCGRQVKHGKEIVLHQKEDARQLHNFILYPGMKKRNISNRPSLKLFLKKSDHQSDGETFHAIARSSSEDLSENSVNDRSSSGSDAEVEDEEVENLAVHRIQFYTTTKEMASPANAHFFGQFSYGSVSEPFALRRCLDAFPGQPTMNDNTGECQFEVHGKTVKRWFSFHPITTGAGKKRDLIRSAYGGGQQLISDISKIDAHNLLVATTPLMNSALSVTKNVAAFVAGALSRLIDPDSFVNIESVAIMVDTMEEVEAVKTFLDSLATSKCQLDVEMGQFYLRSTEDCRRLHNVLVKKFKLPKLLKPKGDKWMHHMKSFDQVLRKGEKMEDPAVQIYTPSHEGSDRHSTVENGEELMDIDTSAEVNDMASHTVYFRAITEDKADYRYAHFINQLSYNSTTELPCEKDFREKYPGKKIVRGNHDSVYEYSVDVHGTQVKRWFGDTFVNNDSEDKESEEYRIACAYCGLSEITTDIGDLDVYNIDMTTTLLKDSKLPLIKNVAAVISGMLRRLIDPELFVTINTVSVVVDTVEETKQIEAFFERLANTDCLLNVTEGRFSLEDTEECRRLHNVLVRALNVGIIPEVPRPQGDDWIKHTTPLDQVQRKGEKLANPQEQISSLDQAMKTVQPAEDNTAFSPPDSPQSRGSPTTPYSASKVAERKRKSRRTRTRRNIQKDSDVIRITEDMWKLPGIESSLKGYDEETKCHHCQALRFQVDKRSSCCQNGKVLLDEWRLPPRLIFDLLNGTHKKSKQFKENIVTYCTLLGFASIQRQDMRPEPHGVQPVKNMGQMYSLSSSLYSLDPKKPGFANMYVLDAQAAKERRAEIIAGMKHHPNIDQKLLEELADVISKYNCFAFAYKSFDEVVQEKRKQGVPEGNIYMRLLDRYDIPKDHPTHPGCLNIPRVGDAINIIFDSQTDEVFKVPDYDSFPRDPQDRQKRMQAMALNNVPVPKGLPVFQKWRRRDEGRGGAPIPAWSPIGEPMAYVLLSPYGDFLFNPKGAKQSTKGSTNKDHETGDPESIRNLMPNATNYPPDNRSQLPRATGKHPDTTKKTGKRWDSQSTSDLQAEDDPMNANNDDNELDEFLRVVQEDAAVDDRDIMPQYAFIDENGEVLPLRKKSSAKKRVAPTIAKPKKGVNLSFDDPNFSEQSDDDEDNTTAERSAEHSPDCSRHQSPQYLQTTPTPSCSPMNFDVMSNKSPPQKRTRRDSEDMMDIDTSIDSDKSDSEVQQFTAEQLNKKSASRRESLAYRLHPRLWNVLHDFHPLISSRKLGQMYVIDQVMRMLDDQCTFIRKKRTVKLSNVKSRVAEYLSRAARRRNINIGTMTTMPATFQGSPRWYRELYEKAIALMNKIGKPDLFITFTGNAKWKEIEENLIKSTCWCDNTALVCQVFWKKFNEFLDDILGEKDKKFRKRPMEGIFGKVRGFVYSVEFQKRGMPHVHMLITLEDKLDSPEKVDAVIKGELPVIVSTMSEDEKERILHLRELVKHLMMHRPCIGRKDYCRKNVPSHWKQCQKRFPKPFVPVTSITDDGYATHMRRNACDGGDDDNEWIVPYNPQLIEKYNCHINVELCASVHSAKYIFKYIFKGVDKVLMELVEGMDSQNLQQMVVDRHIIHPKGVKLSTEVLRYLEEEAKKTLAQHGIAPKDSSGNRVVVYDESLLWKEMRVLTATEATWKAFELPMHGSSHYVESLYVHEKDKEQILIDEDADITAVRQQISDLKSKMTAYFEMMRENPRMQFTYEEMPVYFRFVKNKWIERQYNKDNIIGHIKAVQPRFLQLFALRELAKVVKGATSFEDYLKDDTGDIHPNFAECARARRLLDGETEWTRAMNDSVSINMPSMICRTFAQILVFGCPKQPRELWDSFKEQMYDRWSMPDDQLMARALFHIGSYLRLHNKTLKDYGLPEIDISALKRARSRPLDNEAEELTFSVEDSERLAREMEDTLNDDQKNAVERVTDCINGGGGKSFFLEGSGGTGKTFVYKYLFHKMNSLGKKVEMVAHTGIAATLLINGSTAHGKYRIPLNLDEEEFSKIDIDRATKRANELRNLDAIVWDEATMSDWRMFRCVDILLQKVRDSDLPFGGVCVIAGGDWKQLLPVSSGASPIGAKNLVLKESPVWKHFETITLKKNMRAVQDPEFAAYLEEVGHGTVTSQNEFHRVEIPKKMIRSSLDTVIDELFPRENMQDVNKIKGVCLLTVRNVDALAYNDKIMARLDGVPRMYKSMDRPVEEKSLVAIPPETFHNQTPNGLPPHVLKLKVGCMVMLLRNLNVKRGLCNGTKLTVLKMMDDLLLCETIPVHKEDSPQQVQLFRMPMVSTTRPGEFQFQRMQFPIRLAYCLTINKSQGQTLDKIGIAIKTPVFSHGHMYVALSRAKNSDSVLFHSEKAANDKAAGVTHFTQNIVYRDMIRSASARTQLNIVPSIPAITAVTQVPKIVRATKTIRGDLLLLNRGTDCFLNVIVQMSRAVTEIRNTVFPRWNETWKEFSELCNSVGPHSVSKLRKLIGMDDKRQHDAHEAFSQLVWALGEKEAVHISTKTQTFVKCLQCGEERISDDRATGVLELSASSDTAESITSMFNEYTRWTDDENRTCENCETPSSPGQTPHRTRNQYDFDSNQALCVALPLLYANGAKRKFQLTKQETIFEMGGCKWEIIGAAVHRGQSAYNGHYVCYIKQEKGWKLYNDNEKPIIVGSINRNFLDVACVMLKKHIPQ